MRCSPWCWTHGGRGTPTGTPAAGTAAGTASVARMHAPKARPVSAPISGGQGKVRLTVESGVSVRPKND